MGKDRRRMHKKKVKKPLYERIYEAVSEIPGGKVATYGQIAGMAGIRGHARVVGYALHALSSGTNIPWHRVINARGRISLRSDPEAAEIQKGFLESEGVVFQDGVRVDLNRFQWKGKTDPDSLLSG